MRVLLVRMCTVLRHDFECEILLFTYRLFRCIYLGLLLIFLTIGMYMCLCKSAEMHLCFLLDICTYL